MRLHLGLRKKNEPTTPQLWGNRADRPVTNPAKPTNSVPYFNGRSIWKKRRIFLECGRVLFLSEVKRTEWDERPVGAWRSPMKKTNRSEKGRWRSRWWNQEVTETIPELPGTETGTGTLDTDRLSITLRMVESNQGPAELTRRFWKWPHINLKQARKSLFCPLFTDVSQLFNGEPGIFGFSFIFSPESSALDHLATESNPLLVTP